MSHTVFSYFTIAAITISGWSSFGVKIATASTYSIEKKDAPLVSTSSTRQQERNRVLIQEIANLEVERILLTSRYTLNSLQIKTADKRLQELKKLASKEQPGSEKIIKAAIAQSITAKIAELEVKRIMQGTMYVQTDPQIQVLNEDIQNLQKRFSQIQPRNSRITINRTVAKSLKSKISELQSKRRQLQNQYTAHNAKIVSVNEQIQQLEKRLNMLKLN